jgi:hypothetical protein
VIGWSGQRKQARFGGPVFFGGSRHVRRYVVRYLSLIKSKVARGKFMRSEYVISDRKERFVLSPFQ